MALPLIRAETGYRAASDPREQQGELNLGVNLNWFAVRETALHLGKTLPRPSEQHGFLPYVLKYGTTVSAAYRAIQQDVDLRLTVPFWYTRDPVLNLGSYAVDLVPAVEGGVTADRHESHWSASGAAILPVRTNGGFDPKLLGSIILRGGKTDLQDNGRPFFEATLMLDPVNLYQLF